MEGSWIDWLIGSKLCMWASELKDDVRLHEKDRKAEMEGDEMTAMENAQGQKWT